MTCSTNKKELNEFYPNGSLKESWQFETDTLTGRKETYWPNGNLKVVYNYANGKLNGEYLGFFENGSIARKSFFHNNVLRGLAYRFSRDEKGHIEQETYYLDVEGRQYVYYDRKFSKEGKVINDERTIVIDFACDNLKVMANLNFVGSFPYDSLVLITGRFNENFTMEIADSIDTLTSRKMPVKVMIHESAGRAFRGKCVFYKKTQVGERTRVDVKTRYFEENIDVRCDVHE
jgi:hypothetical protein